MNVKRSQVGSLALLAAALAGSAHGQVESAESLTAPPETAFLDALCFADFNSQLSRLDVFTQIAYEHLSFVKDKDRYAASYDVTISIYDSVDGLVNEKTWTEHASAPTFTESVSPRLYSLTQKVFFLTPARYRLAVVLRDNESGVVRRLSKEMLVRDFTRSAFSLSDIMLLNRLTKQNEKKTIVPNVSLNVGENPESFHVFFEAYNYTGFDSVRFASRILDEKGRIVFESDTVQHVRKGRNELFLLVHDAGLVIGDYRLEIRALPVDTALARKGVLFAETAKPFKNRWHGMPHDLKNLDVAIDQLQYIAKQSELSHMMEATTVQEKQRRFLEFWRKRNSNLNSPRNPKMEQYYARVEYANKYFTRFRPGWKTDMGMVYIIFGPPSNVDRHPFDKDAKPFEIWSYYELNDQFIFVDDSGYGEYRLTTPIYNYWQRPQD